jgi:hypothetical protein
MGQLAALVAVVGIVPAGVLVFLMNAYAGMLLEAKTPFYLRAPVGEWILRLLFRSSYVLRRMGLGRMLDKSMNNKAAEKSQLLQDAMKSSMAVTARRIVFIGSSTFTYWRNIQQDFATLGSDIQILNAGFGGSCTHDIIPWIDELCCRYQPAMVVYFCGTNNLSLGFSDDSVKDGFAHFIERLWEKCPNAHVLYLAITITPFYLKYNLHNCVARALQLNKEMAQFCRDHTRSRQLTYVDTENDEFVRNKSMFLGDRHHLTDEGHSQLAAVLGPVLAHRMKYM